MPFLYRTAVLISRKQPYAEWVSSLGDGIEISDALADRRDVFLGPHSEVEQTLETVLDEIWEDIFAEELFAWSTDEQQWPAHRTREMFHAWFAAELADSIIDLVPDEALTQDDVDLEDLDRAMRACAWCGAEVEMEGGRMATFKLAERGLFEHREGRVLDLLVSGQRIVRAVVTPKDSAPAQEESDLIVRVCSRACEKRVLKAVPDALRELTEILKSREPPGAD